jgi:HPt (histidine-containing phosphotransfer) domain-containing protein
MNVESMPTGRVLDVDGALARFGGDTELFTDMAGFVLEDAPPLFAELRDATSNLDRSGIRMKAHALKGLVSGCGGARAASAAQKVESTSLDGEPSRIETLVEILSDELQALYQALRGYLS